MKKAVVTLSALLTAAAVVLSGCAHGDTYTDSPRTSADTTAPKTEELTSAAAYTSDTSSETAARLSFARVRTSLMQ